MATRLLMVMLTIIAAQAGRTPRISGGGKKVHKYPPTIMPMGRAQTIHASNLLFLSNRIMLAAMRFAMGPNTTSTGPRK